MFKKGQLLRNKHLGYFLEVVSWPLCRWTHGVQALITVHRCDVTLVGNNYQATHVPAKSKVAEETALTDKK